MSPIVVVLAVLLAGALVWAQVRHDRHSPIATAIAVGVVGRTEASTSATNPEAMYATFPRRLNGLSVDAVVLAVLGVAVFGLIEVFPGRFLAGMLLVGSFVGAILYEPVQVARLGGTIGHRVMNLRVVDDRTGGRPTFGRAFVRTWCKGFFGILAFVTMGPSRRHRAIHDMLTHTTVQVRDPLRTQPHHYVRELPLPTSPRAA